MRAEIGAILRKKSFRKEGGQSLIKKKQKLPLIIQVAEYIFNTLTF